MAIHCPKHSLLFLGNPRSASSAMVQHLMEHYGGRQLPQEDIPPNEHHGRIRSKHCNIADLKAAGLMPKGVHTFAILRDPRDIALTWYYYHRAVGREHLADPNDDVHRRKHRAEHMRIALECSFPEWVERVIGSGAYKGDNFSRCANGVDTILRYEHLEEDWRAMLEKLRLPDHGPIQPANVTPGKPSTQETHYTADAMDIVQNVYAEHLEWWRSLSD